MDHIEAALTELPAGVNHTMSFIGIGDHGGGPTQEVIEWCRAHRDAIPGVRLEFSSPSRFFRAVEREALVDPAGADADTSVGLTRRGGAVAGPHARCRWLGG